MMLNCEFKRLIRPFQLSVCLRMIRRCYKQLGLERFLQAFLKVGYKLRIFIQYNLIWTISIV